MSREMCEFGVPTLSHHAEGHARDGVMREPSRDPARSENPGTHGISMRENREIPGPPGAGPRCPVLDGSRGGMSTGAGP